MSQPDRYAWVPGRYAMEHLVLPSLAAEPQRCRTHLPVRRHATMRCPCGRVEWDLSQVDWESIGIHASRAAIISGVYVLDEMSVADVERLLDRVLPL